MPDAHAPRPSVAAPSGVATSIVAVGAARLLRSGLAALGVDGAEVAVLAVRSTGRVRPSASRAGRVAAAAALDGLGIEGRPGRDVHGRPTWPRGSTGAVAHGAGVAVAVCAPLASVGERSTLGVDVERADAVGERVARRIAVPGDAAPATIDSSEGRAVSFSAKESAYKALSFASAPSLTGFTFAGISASCRDDGTFDAVAPDGRLATGRWWVVGDVVLTVAVHTVAVHTAPGR